MEIEVLQNEILELKKSLEELNTVNSTFAKDKEELQFSIQELNKKNTDLETHNQKLWLKVTNPVEESSGLNTELLISRLKNI